MKTVLITDFPWGDTTVEEGVLSEAGLQVIRGPGTAEAESVIGDLVRRHRPDGILTCWAPISESVIASAPNLRVVARLGVGLDSVDVGAATRAGVWVTNVPDYCVEEVSDHAVGMLLAWTRGLAVLDRTVKRGAWAPDAARLLRLQDLTVGIVGFGRIGARTAEKLAGFGCRLLAHSRPQPEGVQLPVRFVGLEALLGESDAVILHVPLLPDTEHMMNDRTLGLMQKGGFLINVSRGPLVDNDALIAALERGQLSGAALDVVEGEPDLPAALVARPDVLVTPHVAYSSISSVAELRRRAAESVVQVLSGKVPANPCNAPKRG